MKTLTAPTTARGKRASTAQDTMDMTMPGDTDVVTVAASTFRLLTTNLHRASSHSTCCKAGVTPRKEQVIVNDGLLIGRLFFGGYRLMPPTTLQ
jgi:hypothetical protein